MGNFDTNRLDISDVQQFDKSGKGGTTTAGALIHETIEQLDKANQGVGEKKKNGESYRGKSQAQKWNKDERTPDRYKAEITNREPKGEGARQKDLDYEKNRSMEKRKDLDPIKHKRP